MTAAGVTVAHDADRCAYVLGANGIARLTPPHAEAWLGLLRAHRELTRRLDGALAERHGLSLSALEVLGRLAAAPERRRRLSRLAGDVHLSVSRVSRIVDALARRGLVERQACDEDSRATNVWLTDDGLALARTAQAAHLDDIQRLFFDHLDAAELETLASVLGRLSRERT